MAAYWMVRLYHCLHTLCIQPCAECLECLSVGRSFSVESCFSVYIHLLRWVTHITHTHRIHTPHTHVHITHTHTHHTHAHTHHTLYRRWSKIPESIRVQYWTCLVRGLEGLCGEIGGQELHTLCPDVKQATRTRIKVYTHPNPH